VNSPIKHYPVLDSTNEEAKRLALAGEQGPLWIIADRQTKGRGRRARHWQSPRGNLAATGLYLESGALLQTAQLGFAAALAVADTVSLWVDDPQKLRLKWPNDVLLREAKLSGILLESGSASNNQHWLAVGIGINLAEAPQNLPYPATCLAEHLRKGIALPTPQEVLPTLIGHYEKWRTCLQQEGFAALRLAWLARAFGLGRPMTTRSGQSGIFEDLSSKGALVLRLNAGQSIEISAGEIYFANEE
jgi:BirA family transcriptional regulator, biotin operon repressor / biotin---[acetyl-CoA-carboxylase] ligase